MKLVNKFFLTILLVGLTIILRQLSAADVQPAISFSALILAMAALVKLTSPQLETKNSASKEKKTLPDNEILLAALFGASADGHKDFNNLALNCSILHLITPDADKTCKLNFAMRLAGEFFRHRTFLLFEISGNHLKFSSGARESSRQTIENILDGDPIIDEMLRRINAIIDVRSAKHNWTFSSPIDFSVTGSGNEGLIVPTLLSGSLTGILACLSTDETLPDENAKNEISLFATNIAIMIDNHEKFHSRLEEKVIEAEEQLAGRLFAGQLPDAPPILNGWNTAHTFFHTPEQNGDFHDYINIPGNRVLIICGKASGKGIKAAVFFTRLKAMIISQVSNYRGPAALLNNLSQILNDEAANELFASLTAIELKASERQVKVAVAGQNIPVINRSRSGYVEIPGIDSGVPLGLFNQGVEPYTDNIIQLLPGDGILIYTDGVFELTAESGERFRTEDLKLMLDRIPEQNADATLMNLKSQLLPVKNSNKPCDDYTLVYAKTE